MNKFLGCVSGATLFLAADNIVNHPVGHPPDLKPASRFLYTAAESANFIAQADAAFVASQPMKRDGDEVSILKYYGAGWDFQVSPATGSSLAEVQAAFNVLKSTPCSIPGFSNWLEYVLGSVKEVRIESKSDIISRKGAAEIEVMSAAPKDGKYYFENRLGEGVIKVTEGYPTLSATLVHEATHLYPIPAVIPSLSGLVKEQLTELFAFSLQMRFLRDRKKAVILRSEHVFEDLEQRLSFESLEQTILSVCVPRVVEGTYSVIISSK